MTWILLTPICIYKLVFFVNSFQYPPIFFILFWKSHQLFSLWLPLFDSSVCTSILKYLLIGVWLHVLWSFSPSDVVTATLLQLQKYEAIIFNILHFYLLSGWLSQIHLQQQLFLTKKTWCLHRHLKKCMNHESSRFSLLNWLDVVGKDSLLWTSGI